MIATLPPAALAPVRRPVIFGSPEDDLYEYACAVISRGLADLARPLDGVVWLDTAACAVLHREGPFQTEVCVIKPGARIPSHIHPGTDTIEYFLTGAAHLTVSGVCRTTGRPERTVARLMAGKGIRIAADAWHEADVLASGSAFLSIQRWATQPPTAITANWVGEPLTATHAARLAAAR